MKFIDEKIDKCQLCSVSTTVWYI